MTELTKKTAAKKPATRKSAKKAENAAAEAVNATMTPPEATGGITAEERLQRIAESAYYRAERRGFSGGDAMQDWLAAEAEVDAQLSSGSIH